MKTPDDLRARAARYRQMALRYTDQPLINALKALADEYETLAMQAETEGSATYSDAAKTDGC